MTLKEQHAFLAGFYSGFMESGEFWNGEVPFSMRYSSKNDAQLTQIAKEKLEEYIQKSRSPKTSKG